MVVMVVAIFSGMRMNDLHEMRSRNVSQIEHTPDAPRHFKFVMEATKNDMEGQGPLSTLTHLVPCICLTHLDDDSSLKFARKLCEDPEVDCAVACPFNVILEYCSRIPDADGSVHDLKYGKSGGHVPLAFFRAITTRGGDNRVFTKNPWGINSLRDDRLPVYLQLTIPTGHSTRRSLISDRRSPD